MQLSKTGNEADVATWFVHFLQLKYTPLLSVCRVFWDRKAQSLIPVAAMDAGSVLATTIGTQVRVLEVQRRHSYCRMYLVRHFGQLQCIVRVFQVRRLEALFTLEDPSSNLRLDMSSSPFALVVFLMTKEGCYFSDDPRYRSSNAGSRFFHLQRLLTCIDAPL